MAERKTTITHQEYLQALALFHLAQRCWQKVDDYHNALADLLGREDANDTGWIGDNLIDGGTLDDALKKEGIDVMPKPPNQGTSGRKE